jgi:propionate CoA-transferase
MPEADATRHALAARLCSPDDAAALIQSDQTLAFSGFGGCCHPEALSSALGRRFRQTGEPRRLTLVHAAGQGDWGSRGLEHLAHPDLVKRIIGGHYATCRTMGQLAVSGAIEAYNFPQGAICQLYRDIAAGRPGAITRVGLGTFVDPQREGGRVNARTTEPLVERIELDGQTWLRYKPMTLHVGLIRAWAADPLGNLVFDGEVVMTEPLAIAQAVRNSAARAGGRGLLIAQVRRLLDRPAPPHQVRVPGVLVDRIVVADEADHPQTYDEVFNERYCSAMPPDGQTASQRGPAMELDERRIIASRTCDELRPGMLVNLGIGIPEGVARIAAERDLIHRVTLTVEAGVIGGTPAGAKSFGASAYPHAIIDQPAMFDFYDGGGNDFAALGCAQVDAQGNVNVSRFNGRLAGCGGFINISQNTPRLVFCGSLTAGGLQIAIEQGRLRIVREGSIRKFIAQVEQVTFSGQRARELNQQVLYVTERAVFRLGSDGLELIEVAPGIDVRRDVLDQMEFRPIVRDVKTMPQTAFRAPAVGAIPTER